MFEQITKEKEEIKRRSSVITTTFLYRISNRNLKIVKYLSRQQHRPLFNLLYTLYRNLKKNVPFLIYILCHV